MHKVILKGHIDVPRDKMDAVRHALPVHIQLTLAEPGCISFEVIEDENLAGRFLVSEVFETKQDFNAHQERTRNSSWFQLTKNFPREYSITYSST